MMYLFIYENSVWQSEKFTSIHEDQVAAGILQVFHLHPQYLKYVEWDSETNDWELVDPS